MYTADELTSLINLAEGAAVELFDLELLKVLKNIQNPNCQKDVEREIVLTVKLKPTDTPGIVFTRISVKPKMAAPNVISTHLLVGSGPGGIEARELYKQQQFWDDKGDKVLPLNSNRLNDNDGSDV